MEVFNITIPYKFQNYKGNTYSEFVKWKREFDENVETKVLEAFYNVFTKYSSKYENVFRDPISVDAKVSSWSFEIYKMEDIEQHSFFQQHRKGEVLAKVNITLVGVE